MMRAIFLAALIGLQASGGSVSGFVTNSVTGAAVGNARVVVWSEERAVMQEAVSDDVGAFRISGIPDGHYMIESAPEGFFGAEIGGLSPTVRVSGDTRFDLKLIPGAILRGRVLDPEGKPATGIAVKIDSWRHDASITDDSGEFVFKDVMPGSYILSAMPGPQADAMEETRIVTTYYPSVVDSRQAASINIEGVDLFGYDLRLRTAPAHRIRGVVIDIDGKPAAHAKVSVFKSTSEVITNVDGAWAAFNGPEFVEATLPVETGEDGGFAFPPILNGNWRVQAVLRSEDASPRRGATEVKVSDGDIENLDVRLAMPFEIEVTADWGDPPTATAPPALIRMLPLDGQPGVVGEAEFGPPQEFALAGRYFIGPGFAQTPGYYLAAVMLGNRDVLRQVVDLSEPTSLKMIYKTGGGSVRGTVEKGAGAMVALMAEETLASRLGYGAKCDANGGFVIPDVPPGEYTLVAFPDPRVLTGSEFPSLLRRMGKGSRWRRAGRCRWI